MQKLFVFLLLFNFFALKAQNLVLNGGFELNDSSCGNVIQRIGSSHIVSKHKWQYFIITSNFFKKNYCLKNIITNGYLYYDTLFKKEKYYKPFNAFRGKRSVGIQSLERDKKLKYHKMLNPTGQLKPYRGYVVLKLSQKLTEGKYILSVAVKYAGYSRCVSSGLGAILTYTVPKEMELGQRHDMEHYDADALLNDNKIIKKGDWQVFNTTINADGGEEYIVIGNFFPKKKIKTKVVNRKTNWRGSYYLIDEVKLINGISEPIVTPQKDSIPIQKNIKMDSLAFELFYNELESQLDTSALLDKMKSIKSYTLRSIRLNGYADSKGNYENNKLLANQRAKNVDEYFKNNWKGIDIIHQKHCILEIIPNINNKKVTVVIIYNK